MKTQLIQERFLEHARETPNAIAITYENVSWTYAEIERRSRAVAQRLRQSGVGMQDRVAILAERGPELVWSVLAVLRLGGVFVVLDGLYPEGRLETLLTIAAPEIMVTAGRNLSSSAGRLAGMRGLPLLSAGMDAGGMTGDAGLFDDALPEDPAYFIFTSGSTGRPKGIACSHLPLVHFIAWHARTFGLTREDRFTMLSGLSHDPLLRDVFTPLSIGARLLIPAQSTITKPGGLRPWFHDTAATVAHLTPAIGQLLVAGGPQMPGLPRLRRLFWGGDQLLPRLVAEIGAFAPKAMHTNFYGCSETPQAVAYFPYDGNTAWPSVPIGTGTDGFQILMVDEQKKPVGAGAVGEIAVKSIFLSLGYVADGRVMPADDRGCDNDGRGEIYYTGDLGRILPDGNAVMLGRRDDQVKIRGYRVDLSEITCALQAHPGVHAAIALPIEEGNQLRIDAFIAVEHAGVPAEAEIKAFLADRLPSYMLPKKIWTFEGQLPLLPNGKIDRKALQAHAQTETRLADNTKDDDAGLEKTSGSATESALIGRWGNIFGSSQISSHASFVSIGGDSLSYVDAYLATEEIIGVVPPDWPEMSIAELAALKVEKDPYWSVVDSFAVIRAVSIVLIVAYHFNLTRIGDGFTGALFMVSGFLFGSMQLQEVFKGRTSLRILHSIKHIFIPTLFFMILSSLSGLVEGRIPPVSEMLMCTDWVDYARLIARHIPIFRHEIIFWYVHALMQILFFLFLILVALPKNHEKPENFFGFSVVLFAAGCFLKFVVPVFLQPDFLSGGAPDLSLFALSPMGNLATFMLGVMLVNFSVIRHKSWLIMAIIGYGVLDAKFYGATNGISIAAAGMIMTATPRLILPRPLAAAVFTLSGAALYIYLSQLFFGYGVHGIYGADWPVGQTASAILGGIGVHALWNWGQKEVRGRLVKLRPSLTRSIAVANE